MRAYHRAGGEAAWAFMLCGLGALGCGPQKSVASASAEHCAERLSTAPPRFEPPPARASRSSELGLELVADRRRIAREIEQRVPVVLASARRRPVGTPGEATYRVTRGGFDVRLAGDRLVVSTPVRSEEHTSELQSLRHLVCRLLL